MLNIELPQCPFCGGNSYRSGSGSMGGAFSEAWYTCNGVQRPVSPGDQRNLVCNARPWLLLSNAGMVVLFLRSIEEEGEHAQAYVNDVLLPTWRDRKQQLEAHYQIEWSTWLDTIFTSRFPDATRTPHGIIWSELPPEAQQLISAQFGENSERKGSWMPLPSTLALPVYPPQLSSALTAFYAVHRMPTTWMRVDPAVSMQLTPPRDPILVNNETYFEAVWKEVETIRGCPLPEKILVPNAYGGKAPWYRWLLWDSLFTVGWRKRVVSIEVQSVLPIPTRRIRALADRDGTTYDARLPPRRITVESWPEPLDAVERAALEAVARESDDGCVEYRESGWKSSLPTATHIIIHAWSQKALVEYLVTLLEAVAPAEAT